MPRAPRDRSKNASEAEWRSNGRSDARPAPGPADLFVCAGLVVTAAVAAFALPSGDAIRFALTIPMLFFVPGYLLLQAAIRMPTPRERVRHGLLAIGISPALVGGLALLTSLVPGGFRSGIIIATVSIGALALAATAWYRRFATPLPRAEPRLSAHAVPDDAE